MPGAAPADLEALNERFVGNAVVYVTGSNRFTLNAQTGERFTETAEIDGVSTTYMGSYGYAGIGPDAGRLTLTYDDGDECAANLYFSTHTAGWFASHCTGSDYPADGTWLGGSWSVEDDEDDEDDGGEVTDTAYGVDDMLPGVPTSGVFVPAVTSGGSVTATGAGTTIALNDGGYFELSDGTRYTCTSPADAAVANGTVTRGTVAGRAAGSGEVDRFPSFRTATGPGAQTVHRWHGDRCIDAAGGERRQRHPGLQPLAQRARTELQRRHAPAHRHAVHGGHLRHDVHRDG